MPRRLWLPCGQMVRSHCTPTTTPTGVSAPPGEALDRFRRMLPTGYTKGTCKPQSSTGAVGVITCGRNSDPGGPSSATYTLTSSPDALRAALNEVVQTTTVVICPGNIQSPVLCPTGVSEMVGDVRPR